MSKICFKAKRFTGASQDLIAACDDIITEYDEAGKLMRPETCVYTVYGELPERWFSHPAPENRFVACLVVDELLPLEAVSVNTGRPLEGARHTPLPVPSHLHMLGVRFLEQPGQVSLRKLVK